MATSDQPVAPDVQETLALVRRHQLLAKLSQKTLVQVIRVSKLITFRKNRAILKTGARPTAVYCLLRGAVRVFHEGDGEGRVLIMLLKAPALLGDVEVLVDIPMMESVTSLEPSEVLVIPAEVFKQLAEKDFAFRHAIVRDLACRLCVASDHQKALAFADIERRLVNLLLDYAQLSGEMAGARVRLGVTLSQDSMAQDLGVSRKAVNLAIAKLRDRGLVTKEGGRYALTNVGALLDGTFQSLGLVHRFGMGLEEASRASLAPNDAVGAAADHAAGASTGRAAEPSGDDA